MKNEESRIQIACVEWFRYQYNSLSGNFFSIPNGGARNAITAKILKAEGTVRGVADLFLSVPRKGFHGMYIEMKTEKGKQQESQKIFQSNVEKEGYLYVVCRSLDDFITKTENYLK